MQNKAIFVLSTELDVHVYVNSESYCIEASVDRSNPEQITNVLGLIESHYSMGYNIFSGYPAVMRVL